MNLLNARIQAAANIVFVGSMIQNMRVDGPHGFLDVFDNSFYNNGEIFFVLDNLAPDFDEYTAVVATPISTVDPPDEPFDQGGSQLKVQVCPPGTYFGFNTQGKQLLRISPTGFDGTAIVPVRAQFSVTVWRCPPEYFEPETP